MDKVELYGIYVNFALIAVAEDKELAEARAEEYLVVLSKVDAKATVTVKQIKLIRVSNQLKY